MKFNLKQDKGVAGLSVLLSLIVFLFIIGLIVMVFSLMGGEISNSDTVREQYTVAGADQNAVNFTISGITLTTCNLYSSNYPAVSTITIVNETGATSVPSTNYTVTGCVVYAEGNSTFKGVNVNISYSFTRSGTALSVINDTTSGIANVTDWYDIFIVIGAMVVLILLTVIIIVSIRGSGIMAGGSNTETSGYGGRNIGSA